MPATRWAASFICIWGAITGAALADEKAKDPVPHLEFRILANEKDDADGLDAAAKYFKAAKGDEKRSAELQKYADEGKPPRAGEAAADAPLKYAWVEIGPAELRTLGLTEGAPVPEEITEPQKALRERVAKAREAGETVRIESPLQCLLFSRACQNTKLSKEVREKKKYEYFFLTRLPSEGKAVPGGHLVSVDEGTSEGGRLCVNFKLDKEGGDLLYELTSKNVPDPSDPDAFYRFLAVIVDGKVISAPRLNSPIRSGGQITGSFTQEQIDAMVKVLRSDIPKDK